MIRIVAPYVEGYLTKATRQALDSLSPERFRVEWERIDFKEINGYWRVLSGHWDFGQTFLVIEQDMVPRSDQLEDLWYCQQLWCGIPHLNRNNSMSCGFGQKFAAQLINLCPGALADIDINRPKGGGWPKTHWWQFAAYLEENLKNSGACLHGHDGELIHLGAGTGFNPVQPGMPNAVRAGYEK